MGIKITGTFYPSGDFGLIDDEHLIGAIHIVDTLEDRNNIPVLRRKFGMLVYVKETDTTYQLKDDGSGDLSDNTLWVEYKAGASYFSELFDTPNTFQGYADYVLKVSNDETKIDFSYNFSRPYTYQPNYFYRTNDLITTDTFDTLYIATQDFSASDLFTDVADGKLKAIAGSGASNYKQIELNATAGDSITITLTNLNWGINRHVFILEKEEFSAFVFSPFTFDENDGHWQYDSNWVIMDGDVYLKTIYSQPLLDKSYFFKETDGFLGVDEVNDIYLLDVAIS